MTETLHEQLSALVDEELPAGEHALLLERLSRDAALRERLGRYQLVNDVLNNRVAMPVDAGFSLRVMQAIAAEPAYHQAPASAWPKLLKPLAGAALAASVALVAVLSVQSLNRDTAPTTAPPRLASAAPSQAPVPVAQGQWDRQAPAVRSRLDGYLVHHNEYAASSGVQGVLPYVRIVGYDSGNE
jgi:sigma-E factor negative regulatory protein RseA